MIQNAFRNYVGSNEADPMWRYLFRKIKIECMRKNFTYQDNSWHDAIRNEVTIYYSTEIVINLSSKEFYGHLAI